MTGFPLVLMAGMSAALNSGAAPSSKVCILGGGLQGCGNLSRHRVRIDVVGLAVFRSGGDAGNHRDVAALQQGLEVGEESVNKTLNPKP